jgi:hypothetical protein
LCARWALPRPLCSLLGCLATFHLVLISWVFFRAATTTDAVTVLTRITQSIPRLPNLLGAYAYTGELILCAALIVFLLLVELSDEKRSLWQRLQAGPVYIRWAVYYVLILALIVIGKWNLKQFVYMQF